MKRRVLAVVTVACVSLTLIGCGLVKRSFGMMVNERDNYLEAQENEKIDVPSDLEGLRIVDIWEIPDIEEIPAAKYYPNAAPRPVSIVGDADPDLIRIQMLGDRRWMVIQRKPDTVWPLVRQFLTFYAIEVESEKPAEGVIVTKPLELLSSNSDSMVHTAIRTENPDADDDDRLMFRVEQGMRRGSSEVHLQYVASADMVKYVDWRLPSKQSEATSAVLRQLAQFEVDDVSDEAVSRIGQDVATLPKIELLRDDLGFPSLRFNVDFERAWATILAALERSPYGIVTRDADTRLIELDVDEDKLSRLQREELDVLLDEIRKQKEEDEPIVVQLEVRPFEQSNDIKIKRSDGKELTLDLAEHFLLAIQQFAL